MLAIHQSRDNSSIIHTRPIQSTPLKLLFVLPLMSSDAKNISTSNRFTAFVKNSKNFIRACKKPSSTEVNTLVKGHLIGLCFLGLFGYIIKVVHIPINNIIAGSDTK